VRFSTFGGPRGSTRGGVGAQTLRLPLVDFYSLNLLCESAQPQHAAQHAPAYLPQAMLRLAGRRALDTRSLIRHALPTASSLNSPLLISDFKSEQQRSALHTAGISNRNRLPEFPPSFVGTSAFSTATEDPPKEQSFLDRALGPDTVWAEPTFTNRWAMVIPAFATHMCIGSPWAWSVMTQPLTCESQLPPTRALIALVMALIHAQCVLLIPTLFALMTQVNMASSPLLRMTGAWPMLPGPSRCVNSNHGR
jgi:hypothetical protein